MKICLLGKNLTTFVLANVLANKKINIDILYSADSSLYRNDTSRTLAISTNNYEYLKANNKKMNISAWPAKKIKIYVEKKNSEELFEFTNKNRNSFFLIKYNEMYKFFFNNLKKSYYVKFKKLKKNDNKSIFEKDYNLIINTDPKSNITKKFFSKKLEKNYNSIAYTFIINHKKIENNIAMQIFTKNGILAFLPLSKIQTSVVFSSINSNKIRLQDLKKIVKKFNNKYEINKYGKLESFSLKFSNLRNYYYKNIISFGDLIHKIHPLAGQGFNMTIRDIKILSKIIEDRIDLGLEIDNSVGLNFEKKTKHINFIYGSGIDFIYKFFNIDHKLNNSLSDPIFKIFRKNNFLNKYATYFSDKGFNI